MSFKPLDIQVNISQMNQVARTQQHEQGLAKESQIQHAQHIIKESQIKDQTIEQTGQSTNEDSLVKERKENQKRKLKYKNKKKQQEEQEKSQKKQEPDDEKGHIIDTMR